MIFGAIRSVPAIPELPLTGLATGHNLIVMPSS
jgi:hypothetical protein